MKRIIKSIMQLGVICLICFGLFNLQSAWAGEGNIDVTYKYAWSENSGWENFRPTHGGVTVNDTYLSGYAWAENIGWVKLGSGTGPYDNTTSADWGVNRDGSGNLSGYAWSENVGWINFNPTNGGVTINTTTLKFDGYAWAENVGFIHFQNASPEYYVAFTAPEINLKQDTTNIPDGGSHNFGSHVVGTDTDVVFTIENTGTANLTVSTSISITGANADQFSVHAQPSSPVAPSGSTTFTIRFSPTTTGAKTASIAITNNDSNENPYNLTLNAAGTTSALNYLKVEDAANGTGSEVDTHSMTADQTYTVHAAGYDQYGNYISDQSVTWTGTGVCSGNLSPTTGTSTTFTAVTTGTGTITADHASATDDTTGTITVSAGGATQVILTGPSTVTAGDVSTAFTLTSRDADDNTSNVTQDTVFSLTSNSTGTATFYSDAAGTAAITQVTITNGTSTATFYYKDTETGTPTVTATSTSGMSLGSDTHQITVSLAATTLAASTSVALSFKDFKVTVTKIEMNNGISWVTIFSGTAELDLVNGSGTFPGISDVFLPSGTYNQIRVTFRNSLPVTGTLSYNGADYYTTTATFGGESNLASTPGTNPGSEAIFTFRIDDWGALNEDVTQTYSITPVTVGPATDYQPTLRFTISNTLLFKGTAGTDSTYYFTLGVPTVSIVEP